MNNKQQSKKLKLLLYAEEAFNALEGINDFLHRGSRKRQQWQRQSDATSEPEVDNIESDEELPVNAKEDSLTSIKPKENGITVEAFNVLDSSGFPSKKDGIKRFRSCYMRTELRDKNRTGFFVVSFLKEKKLDSDLFLSYTNMNRRTFEQFLSIMKPALQKKSVHQPLSVELRLAVLLRYLAQGLNLKELADSFKLGKETARAIVLDASQVWKVLSNIYIPEPGSQELSQIAEDFYTNWQLPNCVGAVAIKHVPCYLNKFHIQLIAACDAKYRFTYVDSGAYGRAQETG